MGLSKTQLWVSKFAELSAHATFFGLPYIDVRLSFNSFIPADLDEGLAGRLVDYYINRLLSEPNLHDKVEFEIVFSLLHAGSK